MWNGTLKSTSTLSDAWHHGRIPFLCSNISATGTSYRSAFWQSFRSTDRCQQYKDLPHLVAQIMKSLYSNRKQRRIIECRLKPATSLTRVNPTCCLASEELLEGFVRPTHVAISSLSCLLAGRVAGGCEASLMRRQCLYHPGWQPGFWETFLSTYAIRNSGNGFKGHGNHAGIVSESQLPAHRYFSKATSEFPTGRISASPIQSC